MPRRPVRIALTSAVGLALIGGGFVAGTSHGETPAPTPTRTELAATNDVRGAAKRTLALSRIEVPAGSGLALHHHTGTRVSRIEQGALAYSVKTGQVTVMRGDAEKPTRVRTIKAGQTGTLRTGHWIVEQPEMLHSVENRGKTDAVVVQATLFPRGAEQTVED